MPQDYVNDFRTKRYKKPIPDDLQKALRAVKSKQVTYREAEEIYGIHFSVIYRHVNKSNIKKQGGQTALTESEEQLLIERILLRADWGFPLEQLDLRLLVKGYLNRKGKQFGNKNTPGREWASRFLTRHKNVMPKHLFVAELLFQGKLSTTILTI